MKLVDMQTKDYLELVASDAPAPGGGSASALCGSQGIGLIGMVAKLTEGKEKYAEYKSICEAIILEADELCKRLCEQIDIDTEAYGRIANAFKLPKITDEEKVVRRQAIAEATVFATEVPLETMRLGVQGLFCAEKLIGNYNTNCASDVGCGIYGLLSCVKGAWLNVRINVGGLSGEKGVAMKEEGAALLEKAESLAARLDAQVSACIS